MLTSDLAIMVDKIFRKIFCWLFDYEPMHLLMHASICFLLAIELFFFSLVFLPIPLFLSFLILIFSLFSLLNFLFLFLLSLCLQQGRSVFPFLVYSPLPILLLFLFLFFRLFFPFFLTFFLLFLLPLLPVLSPPFPRFRRAEVARARARVGE